MNKSDSIDALAVALAKAQAKIEGAVKDKSNPAFRSKYADLGACWDAIRGPLTENGLSVVQFPRTLEAAVEVETILLHSSGQYLSDVFAIPVSKRDAHGFMSATTYARRGALMAVAGIAPVDDDGNGATGRRDDPIAEAKHTAITEDRHLLVNGETRSNYEVNKDKNGGKTDYMAAKEKEIYAWLNAALAEIPTLNEVEDWWDEPERKKKIEWVRKNMPKQFDDLWQAAERRIAQLRPIGEYRA